MDNVQTPLFVPASSSNSAIKGSGSNGAAVAPGTSLNIDDIFGDCFFTPNGETVFLDHDDEGAIGELANILRRTYARTDPCAHF